MADDRASRSGLREHVTQPLQPSHPRLDRPGLDDGEADVGQALGDPIEIEWDLTDARRMHGVAIGILPSSDVDDEQAATGLENPVHLVR